jgi:hypothetical protein
VAQSSSPAAAAAALQCGPVGPEWPAAAGLLRLRQTLEHMPQQQLGGQTCNTNRSKQQTEKQHSSSTRMCAGSASRSLTVPCACCAAALQLCAGATVDWANLHFKCSWQRHCSSAQCVSVSADGAAATGAALQAAARRHHQWAGQCRACRRIAETQSQLLTGAAPPYLFEGGSGSQSSS